MSSTEEIPAPPELLRAGGTQPSDTEMTLDQAHEYLVSQLSAIIPPERRTNVTTLCLFFSLPFNTPDLNRFRDWVCNYISVYSQHFNCKLQSYNVECRPIKDDPDTVEFHFVFTWTNHIVGSVEEIKTLTVSEHNFCMADLVKALDFDVDEPVVLTIHPEHP